MSKLDEYIKGVRERSGKCVVTLGGKEIHDCTTCGCRTRRLLAIIEAQRAALNEAAGLVSAHEEAIRADSGNTNVACFREKLAAIEAKFAEGSI